MLAGDACGCVRAERNTVVKSVHLPLYLCLMPAPVPMLVPTRPHIRLGSIILTYCEWTLEQMVELNHRAIQIAPRLKEDAAHSQQKNMYANTCEHTYTQHQHHTNPTHDKYAHMRKVQSLPRTRIHTHRCAHTHAHERRHDFRWRRQPPLHPAPFSASHKLDLRTDVHSSLPVLRCKAYAESIPPIPTSPVFVLMYGLC